MKKFAIALAAGFSLAALSPNALAIKEFGETWVKTYAEKSESEDFKKLVAEAKCNVCHIDMENKKKHNPYGETLKTNGLLKKTFPAKLFKDKPEEARKQVEEIFKKVEDMKAEGQDKSFSQRMKEGLLPGGDVKGK